MNTSIHWVGISGSLRSGSYNTRLLKAVSELLPEGITMEIISFADVPLYNGDLDLPETTERPPAVARFRDSLAKADGLVIVSPEYNYSIPGGLKNALDWASRGEDSPLRKMPVALMGATTGMWGTVRMQTGFLPFFVFLGMKPVLQPEILVAQAKDKFDEKGNFTDEKARSFIRKKLEGLKVLSAERKKGV